MRTLHAEAVSLFRKWMEEFALLYCEVNFIGFACGFETRLTFVSDAEVRGCSDDGRSQIAVDLNRAVAFGYADTRGTPDVAQDFLAGVIVFFSEPSETDNFERIGFMERRQPE